jgi:hypothetical protein
MDQNFDTLASKIDEIAEQLQTSQDQRLEAFTSLLGSIESTLADLLENIENGGGAAAIDAMAKALGTLKMAAPDVKVTNEVRAPAVTVNVPKQAAPVINNHIPEQPAPVVHNHMPAAAAPIIHLMEAPQKNATWKITKHNEYGPPTVLTITRET